MLRIVLSDTPVEESDEEKPGLILDYNKDGNVVGLEVLDASKRVRTHGRSDTISLAESGSVSAS